MDAFVGLSSKSELISLIDSTYSQRGRRSGFPPLNMSFAVSELTPTEIVTVEKVDPKFSIQIDSELKDGLVEFTVSRRWGGKEEEEKAFLLCDGQRWIFLCAGENPSVLKGALYRLQPMVTTLRIFSSDLLELSENVSKHVKYFEMEEALLRRKDQSIRAYKNVTIAQLRELVTSEHRWIQRVRYRVSVDDSLPRRKWFNASISRRGEAELFSGYLSLFMERAIMPAYEASLRTYSYMASRRSTPELTDELPPARIAFDEVIDARSLKNIVEAMNSIEKMHYVIAQEGNPFLLLHLLDAVDGSSLDLLASGKEICLIPVQKVTPNSYVRVTEALFDKLQDGRLVAD